MMARKWIVGLLGVALAFLLATPPVVSAGTIVDGFEDGAINNSLWDYGGRRFGISEGSWSSSQTEVTDPTDGYLELRVNGPPSGGSFGSVSWLMTKHNYNDGQSHLINFDWAMDSLETDSHLNLAYFQITDGYMPTLPEDTGLGSILQLPPRAGLTNLSHGSHTGWPEAPGYASDTGMLSYSIEILPDATVKLYDSPDATGSLLDQKSLDASYAWHLRLMAADAASSNLPAGNTSSDTRLNIYSFSSESVADPNSVPEPSSFVVMAGLAASAAGCCCVKKYRPLRRCRVRLLGWRRR